MPMSWIIGSGYLQWTQSFALPSSSDESSGYTNKSDETPLLSEEANPTVDEIRLSLLEHLYCLDIIPPTPIIVVDPLSVCSSPTSSSMDIFQIRPTSAIIRPPLGN